jgi:hypothetical protein
MKMSLTIRFTFAWLVVTTAWAQAVTVAPVVVDRGSANIFRLLLKPQRENPVVALQWELAAPRGIQIDPAGAVPGTVSESAGKSISCSNRTDPKDGTRICVCILVGGIQPIQEGVIAIVKFNAASDIPAGQAVVQLQKIEGVTADLKRVQIPGVPVVIKVQ